MIGGFYENTTVCTQNKSHFRQRIWTTEQRLTDIWTLSIALYKYQYQSIH